MHILHIYIACVKDKFELFGAFEVDENRLTGRIIALEYVVFRPTVRVSAIIAAG